MKSHFCLLLIAILSTSFVVSAQRLSEVSNTEIRDAILSLVHSYSLLDNKLERHEQRERSLGELVKKGIISIQKNQRILEPLKGTISRLEERVSSIETVLLAQEEKASMQQMKLAEALEAVLKWMNENSKQFGGKIEEPTSKEDEDDEGMSKKIEELSDNVNGLRREIAELRTDKDTTEETNKNLLAQTEKLVNSKIASADEVIIKLEEKLSQFYITSPAIVPSPVHNTEWEEKIAQSLKEIKSDINNIKSFPSDILLPDREFIHSLANETLEAIEDMKLEVLTASDKSFTKTATRIKETNEKLEESISEVLKTLTEETSASETFFSDTKKSLDKVQEDIGNLDKLEKFLLQTGENVLDAKRGIDYGVHQILREVGDIVKLSAKDLNSTITKRFDSIGATILDNHNGALTNLSSKIETEISQVWRQIGIMYQEISSSKQALDRLQQQSEVYVNGTLNTMDSMEGKVTLITGRMAEVDSNLNYLLGRLSLVTQEFNQIKLGLGSALDNIRSSFLTVQEKVKGPGPHQIPTEENQTDFNGVPQRDAPEVN